MNREDASDLFRKYWDICPWQIHNKKQWVINKLYANGYEIVSINNSDKQ